MQVETSGGIVKDISVLDIILTELASFPQMLILKSYSSDGKPDPMIVASMPPPGLA